MNSERPARPRWSLSSSAIWTPVNKPHSRPAPMRLSVKVRRRSVWPNACESSPQRLFLANDATWLNERDRTGALCCPERRHKLGQLSRKVRRFAG